MAHFFVGVFFDYPLVVCQPSNQNCNAKTVHVCVDFHTVAETAMENADFIPKSGTLSGTLFFTGPDELPLGTIDVEVVGDSVTEGAETFKVVLSNSASACQNEANIGNREARATIVADEAPKPDLIVSDITLQRDCKIELTIKNEGPGPLPDQAYDPTSGVAIQMRRNGQAWGGIRLAAVDPAKKLKVPGASVKDVWFPGAANLRLSKGSHTISVTVDRFNAVSESNEQNNVTTKRLLCNR